MYFFGERSVWTLPSWGSVLTGGIFQIGNVSCRGGGFTVGVIEGTRSLGGGEDSGKGGTFKKFFVRGLG